MTGAEKIIEKILEEARIQARTIIKNAENEAEGIINSAKDNAAEKEKEIMEKAQAEAVELKKRLLAVSELEARKKRLSAKQEAIEEIFSEALQKLKELPDDEYETLIVDMAVSSAKTGNETIIMSEQDKARLSSGFIDNINKKLNDKGINGRVKLADDTNDIHGGFILKEGSIEVNNSFNAIFKMRRDEIEPQVVKVIF
jgi:V/A-type H+-transporting ATPase subunit E